jgi:hypothetical protein
MTGIQAKLLAILASLLTALPPSACCLLVLQPCCAWEISQFATGSCCRQRLAEPALPSCCAHEASQQSANLPLAPGSEGPCPAEMCCCVKSPVIAPVVGAAWQPELSVPLYLLPADWGTLQSHVSGVVPAWAMHPPSAALHVLLCVWRC